MRRNVLIFGLAGPDKVCEMRSIFILVAFVYLTPLAHAQTPVEYFGAASVASMPPQGAGKPPKEIHRTANFKGPTPTNDWWSSLAWSPFSERHYPHPLAVEATKQGLRVYFPGAKITANRDAIFAFMPAEGGRDLVLGNSAQTNFPDARVAGWSDWFVTVEYAAEQGAMSVSYGHGSPFVYARYTLGRPKITFAQPPILWSGDTNSSVLGISLGDSHYGLFGPRDSTWAGLGSLSLVNEHPSRDYFSLAVLPDNRPETLALFARYAHAHVTDTRFTGSYDSSSGIVSTRFSFATRQFEGESIGTLFALYPHQWRHGEVVRELGAYRSVRGVMKLTSGTSFETKTPFPGVLPVLPQVGGADSALIATLLDQARRETFPPVRDTYWEGKWLGKMATVIALAEQHGRIDTAEQLRSVLRGRLESWFTAIDREGKIKTNGLFAFEPNWGTLIGYPASFGSDVDLNDHHFHYGYFIKAAAEIARRDPAWASEDRWGAVVKLLIDDIACPRRDDARFPFLRNFDPYAGHSWASGHAKFGDGNNNESSSEAMNAWCAIILWGEATNNRAMRDLGIVLFTNELAAIEEYWFDVHDENHPPEYTPSVVTMIWGGKGANGTWFSANPEAVHGINWLPFHGGSLYLGRYPEYVTKNYQALVLENGGEMWDQWADLIWMYRALSDPEDALRQWRTFQSRYPSEDGVAPALAYHWIANLSRLGRVERSVSANTPLYAVLSRQGHRTYIVYNSREKAHTVTFSDGVQVLALPKRFTLHHSAGK